MTLLILTHDLWCKSRSIPQVSEFSFPSLLSSSVRVNEIGFFVALHFTLKFMLVPNAYNMLPNPKSSILYRAENKDIQTLSHLKEEEAKICGRGLTAGFTHGFRSIYRSTDEYDKNYKGNMNLLHVVMWRKIRSLWRAGPELLFQGYGGSILSLPSPACEKETDSDVNYNAAESLECNWVEGDYLVPFSNWNKLLNLFFKITNESIGMKENISYRSVQVLSPQVSQL
ncbi:hypothetical protein TURU_062085 [Turdus rufiventris]|nr:hypothetical protein TURU_062085 [Turdus rufiventris]